MLSDAQLDELRETMWDTLAMLNDFFNSPSFWETLGAFLGVILSVSIITALMGRVFSWVGLHSR